MPGEEGAFNYFFPMPLTKGPFISRSIQYTTETFPQSSEFTNKIWPVCHRSLAKGLTSHFLRGVHIFQEHDLPAVAVPPFGQKVSLLNAAVAHGPHGHWFFAALPLADLGRCADGSPRRHGDHFLSSAFVPEQRSSQGGCSLDVSCPGVFLSGFPGVSSCL